MNLGDPDRELEIPTYESRAAAHAADEISPRALDRARETVSQDRYDAGWLCLDYTSNVTSDGATCGDATCDHATCDHTTRDPARDEIADGAFEHQRA